ncbi:hypothetical protein ECH7EC508_3579 [Escherichia coli O157:H7 str. EC508]|nr:hypothetical protein ECH7EC508_3579 [Escherichia coli O157:H7 str. EC508]
MLDTLQRRQSESVTDTPLYSNVLFSENMYDLRLPAAPASVTVTSATAAN